MRRTIRRAIFQIRRLSFQRRDNVWTFSTSHDPASPSPRDRFSIPEGRWGRVLNAKVCHGTKIHRDDHDAVGRKCKSILSRILPLKYRWWNPRLMDGNIIRINYTILSRRKSLTVSIRRKYIHWGESCIALYTIISNCKNITISSLIQ